MVDELNYCGENFTTIGAKGSESLVRLKVHSRAQSKF